MPPKQGPLARFSDYFGLCVGHILAGLDHLLFVFALLLLICRLRPPVAAWIAAIALLMLARRLAPPQA
ncbi:hypothetical protein C2I36_16490 [Rhodobacteraceae bacterium WD3A24]|nr:hypothetical protein C2I36_16490 [Rhodobacteraceae bacterium WD3A24]